MSDKVSFVDLGHGCARIRIVEKEDVKERQESVVEFLAPAYQAGGFYPAASFRVYGKAQMEKLRDALVEALSPKQEG